jgi:hypothetical protein
MLGSVIRLSTEQSACLVLGDDLADLHLAEQVELSSMHGHNVDEIPGLNAAAREPRASSVAERFALRLLPHLSVLPAVGKEPCHRYDLNAER